MNYHWTGYDVNAFFVLIMKNSFCVEVCKHKQSCLVIVENKCVISRNVGKKSNSKMDNLKITDFNNNSVNTWNIVDISGSTACQS